MRNNIRLGLERGANLDDLEIKAEDLSNTSNQFANNAHRVRQKFWWQNVQMWILIGVIVIILIVIIVETTMTATFNNPNYQPTSVRYTPSTHIQQLQDQTDEIVSIQKKTLSGLLDRGTKLDDLEYKADEMARASDMFTITTGKLKKRYQIKNFKMTIILAVIVIVIITAIIVTVVLSVKSKA
ncbi:unnamed protein product [Adineta ricciae]|uniref:V-SNARE coiled-coil homology domain-containing protein n=1 Tax=Adineta ricciae TaxID=249248 RepID=A0A814KZV0_ADIRI|nr:unnamed protein product [Adineta ricciae]